MSILPKKNALVFTHDVGDKKHNLLETKLMDFQKTIEANKTAIAANNLSIYDLREVEGIL